MILWSRGENHRHFWKPLKIEMCCGNLIKSSSFCEGARIKAEWSLGLSQPMSYLHSNLIAFHAVLQGNCRQIKNFSTVSTSFFLLTLKDYVKILRCEFHRLRKAWKICHIAQSSRYFEQNSFTIKHFIKFGGFFRIYATHIYKFYVGSWPMFETSFLRKSRSRALV